MSTQALIITLLVVVLVGLVILWCYVYMHRERLNALHEKTDQVLAGQKGDQDKTDLMLASQEGGRMQSSRQHDESTHQDSKIMARMQTILLIIDKWMKNHDKDKPP